MVAEINAARNAGSRVVSGISTEARNASRSTCISTANPARRRRLSTTADNAVVTTEPPSVANVTETAGAGSPARVTTTTLGWPAPFSIWRTASLDDVIARIGWSWRSAAGSREPAHETRPIRVDEAMRTKRAVGAMWPFGGGEGWRVTFGRRICGWYTANRHRFGIG